MAYTTINKSTDYFNTKLYTGNGSTNAQTGVGFKPDWLWVKCRSDANGHQLFDALRTTYSLSSNETAAEANRASDGFTSLDSDGFTMNGSGSGGSTNVNGRTYASWNWKANGSGSSNTDGTINTTSTSVNTTAGFSICKYTGTGANATVGHGLGAVPKMIITKNLDEGGSNQDWCVYHKDVGSNGAIFLNLTNTKDTHAKYFNDTNPTSSVFSIGTNLGTNGSGDNMIAYCFAEKAGYSKFGKYTGNGNADGTFIYTGFKPAFVMSKRTDATDGWRIMDATRSSFNVAQHRLLADSSAAEVVGASQDKDFLSNGFKIRNTDSGYNGSGNSYIYMAFGQSIVGSNNIPATAR